MSATSPKNDAGDDQQKDANEAQQIRNDNDQNVNPAEASTTTAKKRKRIQRLVRVLLVFPYVAGIIWTCLHPIVSVITGELKCRGWYLDEHSIETRFTAGQSPQAVPSHLENLQSKPIRSKQKTNGKAIDVPYSLCDFFGSEDDPGVIANNLICHTHGDYFEMAVIMPLSNAIAATEEAVVLVVPKPSDVYPSSSNEGEEKDWNSSTFHQAMVQSINHLANPVETPWLAKMVLVVTPTISNGSARGNSLERTVSNFLDAYSGSQTTPHDYQRKRRGPNYDTIPQLPPRLSGAILRNLIVFEIEDTSTESSSDKRSTHIKPTNTDLSILPQGKRGVLPNADLVFLVGKLMDKTIFYAHARKKTFLTHPYTQESKKAELWINRWIDGLGFLSGNRELKAKAKTWAKGMINVSLFARTLAVGPFPPHAAALERGIDSLTIRAKFEGTFRRDPAVELVQYSEYIVRSLANLHERLHHSFTLYLLPSPKDFVSHIEYLLPNILVLLPLAVRVFGILLPSMKRGLDLTAVGGVVLAVLIVALCVLSTTSIFDSSTSPQIMAVVLLLVYAGVTIFWVQKILRRNHHSQSNLKESSTNQKEDLQEDKNPDTTRTILTLQFVTCALTVYILVPIAFAHASLSYLPSVLWTPLLAFPDYVSMKRSNSKSILHKFVVIPILCILAVLTAPPFVLVPMVFTAYTPFVLYAYTPIHLFFCLLVTSIIVA